MAFALWFEEGKLLGDLVELVVVLPFPEGEFGVVGTQLESSAKSVALDKINFIAKTILLIKFLFGCDFSYG